MIQGVCIIGTGNVAWHLTKRIIEAGIEKVQVFGKNTASVREISKLSPNILTTTDPNEIMGDAHFYILCVPDDSIAEVAAKIPFSLTPSQVLLHTSGAVSGVVLKSFASSYGVLWPVQSLVKNIEIIHENLPLIITASDTPTADEVKTIAQLISNNVAILSDKQKSAMHVAAVIINNFVNHLYSLTSDYCKSQVIPFEYLYPLIVETSLKLQCNAPEKLQTGPARRSDHRTLEKHKMLLKNYPELLDVYTLFSTQIHKKYNDV
jgi:predicted short-subunit dehydrogenase-like oxidoreductase (DUF2520 family)